MPDEHKLYAQEWNPDRFRKWAASVGPACLSVIELLLSSKPHPALSYRSCMGVLSFARSRSNTFLEEICKRAVVASKKPSYAQIKMLAQSVESTNVNKTVRSRKDSSIGSAGLVRGADYYRLESNKDDNGADLHKDEQNEDEPHGSDLKRYEH
jgi:hypothetical protein